MNKTEWDEGAGHPMQRWAWGEFRTAMGNKVSRVASDRQYQIIWSRIPYSPWWFGYIPMGPIPTVEDIKRLRDEAIKNEAIGIRMEPNEQVAQLHSLPVGQLVPGRQLFKPKTYWIDLTRNEEELLLAMYPKTRYNIRRAQKHGVTVKEDGAAMDEYIGLMFGKTTKRQGIYSHTDKYHRMMWEGLSQAGIAKLFAAQWRGKVIAAWMIFVGKEFAYYAYGAFDEAERDKMAPILGLWEIIKWAKRGGYKTLDLWGAEEGKGFSRFKEQFGPQMVEMAGTYDLPVRPGLYRLFRLAEEVRWKVLRILR